MYFDGMKNLKADQLDQDFVIAIINKAGQKISTIENNLYDKAENDEQFNFNETQLILMCMMYNNLLDISETIGDLTSCITVGAASHMQEKMGLTDEEIAELEEDELQEYIAPYIATQHTFAAFNNNEIRNMLYEISKYILSDTEFIMIAIGL